MDPLYDVCFAGEILEGQDLNTVKLKLAKLFNANDVTLEKLFSGKTQLLKRGCDRETALKYKKAIEQAGAKPVIRNSAPTTPTEAPKAEPQPMADAATAPKMTAAERIALLAAAPDVSGSHSEVPDVAASTATESESESDPESEPNTDQESGNFDLAPTGADILRPEERQAEATSNIPTSDMELMSVGSDLSDITEQEASAPDVTHLSMGEVGEDIPNLLQTQELISPDISAIELSPEDSDFSDCAPTPAAELDVDLSAIELAPSGTDLLDSQYRKSNDEVAPKTDHLSLED